MGRIWEKVLTQDEPNSNPEVEDQLRSTLNFDKAFLCPFSQKVFNFNKHADLDKYLSISGTLQNLFITFPADFLFLKVLDRAFWIEWVLANLANHHDTNSLSNLNCKPGLPCPLQDPFVVENKENY